jgi:indolepyruvate ferredoxin oxidoreductase
MILLGAAFQHGCLPVPAEAIEAAITLNGVATGDNIRAFRWGRAAATDHDAVVRSLAPPTATVEDPATLAELVDARAADLADYQDPGYGAQYRARVEAVAEVERGRMGDGAMAVSMAYAAGLYKLMAYKDEYEVARLHLDPTEKAKLADQFGDDARVKVLLHPPLLRALGLRHKIRLGKSATAAFRVLRASRRLRGTALDPFGHTAVRRLERRLPDEYDRSVARALEHLSPDTVDRVTAIAALPDLVRGYESIKEANVVRYRARMEELLTELSGLGVQDTKAER